MPIICRFRLPSKKGSKSLKGIECMPGMMKSVCVGMHKLIALETCIHSKTPTQP